MPNFHASNLGLPTRLTLILLEIDTDQFGTVYHSSLMEITNIYFQITKN